MRPVPFQPMLFEVEEPDPNHLHYATTNTFVVKVGMTAKSIQNRMKRDGQFKGHVIIWAKPAPSDCRVHIVGNKKKCDWEIRWEQAFEADRLPVSEQYAPSPNIITALRFGARDERAMAAIDSIRPYGMEQTA